MEHFLKILLICILSLVSFNLLSQGLVNNGAKIVVTSGVTLKINGDASGGFTNKTSGSNQGTIDLDGNMVVEGNWTNNASSGVVLTNIDPFPNGTVLFYGTTMQTIGGSATTTFENMTINNNVSGTAVNLGKNTTVKGWLTMYDGIITTNVNKIIIENTSFYSMYGYSTGCFINGNLRRYITSGNTYTLPLGNGTTTTNYHRADFINNIMIGTSYIDASVSSITETSPNIDANLNTSQFGIPIQDIRETAIWTITPDAPIGFGSYGVNLYVENMNFDALYDNKFCVVKRGETSTTYADWNTFEGTTSIPADGASGRVYNMGFGYGQRTGFTTFSQFALGIASTPLPVELINFAGVCDDNNIQLNWTTASELNNDYFTVERFNSGNDQPNEFDIESSAGWIPIATIEGAGSSSSVEYYSFKDLTSGENEYYRLKQTDFDGQFKYTKPINVVCENDLGSMLNLYPNPTRSYVICELYYPKEINVNISIFNSLGQKIFRQYYSIIKTNKIQINTDKLCPGIYTLLIESETGGKISSEKLVIK